MEKTLVLLYEESSAKGSSLMHLETWADGEVSSSGTITIADMFVSNHAYWQCLIACKQLNNCFKKRTHNQLFCPSPRYYTFDLSATFRSPWRPPATGKRPLMFFVLVLLRGIILMGCRCYRYVYNGQRWFKLGQLGGYQD